MRPTCSDPSLRWSVFADESLILQVMDLGSNPERAASFKLVGNTMILGVLELLAESMTLGSSFNCPPRRRGRPTDTFSPYFCGSAADQSGVGKENLYKLIQGASTTWLCSLYSRSPRLTDRTRPLVFCRDLPRRFVRQLRQEAAKERLWRRAGVHPRRRHPGRFVRLSLLRIHSCSKIRQLTAPLSAGTSDTLERSTTFPCP